MRSTMGSSFSVKNYKTRFLHLHVYNWYLMLTWHYTINNDEDRFEGVKPFLVYLSGPLIRHHANIHEIGVIVIIRQIP